MIGAAKPTDCLLFMVPSLVFTSNHHTADMHTQVPTTGLREICAGIGWRWGMVANWNATLRLLECAFGGTKSDESAELNSVGNACMIRKFQRN